MSGRFSLIIEKRFCAECSLTLSWSVGKRDGGESLDWENGRITIDFDGSKITVDRVHAVSKDSVERPDHQLIDAIK